MLKLENFELKRKISKGISSVYEAYHTKSDNKYAVKLIHIPDVEDIAF